jgi:hypothetical protein
MKPVMRGGIVAILLLLSSPWHAVAELDDVSIAALEQEIDEDLLDENIFGIELMNGYERAEYRAEMGSLESDGEREIFKQEHREEMLQKARERGITLTD